MPGQEASAKEQALPEQAEQHAPSQPEVADVALHILLVGIMVMRTARRVFMMGMLLGVVIDSLLGTVRFQAQRWSYEGGPHQGCRRDCRQPWIVAHEEPCRAGGGLDLQDPWCLAYSHRYCRSFARSVT